MPRRCFVWLFTKSNLRYELYCIISAVVLIAALRAYQADAAERTTSDSTKVAAATNQMALDAVVADVLEHNPELNFYNAEIAAAKGQARPRRRGQIPISLRRLVTNARPAGD